MLPARYSAMATRIITENGRWSFFFAPGMDISQVTERERAISLRSDVVYRGGVGVPWRFAYSVGPLFHSATAIMRERPRWLNGRK